MKEASHIAEMIWLNGKMLPADEASISPLDRGFLVGEGVFETLRAYRGFPFATKLHWQRLCDSSKIFALTPPTESVFTNAVEESLNITGIKEARVRVTLTGGTSMSSTENTMTVSVMPATIWPPTSKVKTVPWVRNERSPLTGAKSISYAENTIALAYAKEQGADEAIFGNTCGDLCEGSTSNVFYFYEDRLITPPLSSGCLGGVTRNLVLKLCRENKIAVEEKATSIDNFENSTEAFLTSSTREVHPISHINNRPKNQAKESLTLHLSRLYKQLVNESIPS